MEFINEDDKKKIVEELKKINYEYEYNGMNITVKIDYLNYFITIHKNNDCYNIQSYRRDTIENKFVKSKLNKYTNKDYKTINELIEKIKSIKELIKSKGIFIKDYLKDYNQLMNNVLSKSIYLNSDEFTSILLNNLLNLRNIYKSINKNYNEENKKEKEIDSFEIKYEFTKENYLDLDKMLTELNCFRNLEIYIDSEKNKFFILVYTDYLFYNFRIYKNNESEFEIVFYYDSYYKINISNICNDILIKKKFKSINDMCKNLKGLTKIIKYGSIFLKDLRDEIYKITKKLYDTDNFDYSKYYKQLENIYRELKHVYSGITNKSFFNKNNDLEIINDIIIENPNFNLINDNILNDINIKYKL